MNRNFIFVSLTVAVGVNLAIIGCHRKGDAEAAGTGQLQTASRTDSNMAPADSIDAGVGDILEVKTFQNGEPVGGYGYDVYRNSNLEVHQQHIPAIMGKKGFATEANARRTGDLVAYKIRNKIWPPSVTVRELDSLGVLPGSEMRKK